MNSKIAIELEIQNDLKALGLSVLFGLRKPTEMLRKDIKRIMGKREQFELSYDRVE